MALLDRLKRLLSRGRGAAQEAPQQPEHGGERNPGGDGASPALVAELPEEASLSEELELRDVLRAEAAGDVVNLEPRRVLEQVAAIINAGREPAALDLVRRLARRFPDAHELGMRLAELLYDQGHEADAAELLRDLVDHPAVALDAHFLLGEHHVREAEPDEALHHYEAVLAVDFQYPKARRRADDLRRQLARPAAGMAAPTLLGAEDLGAGARFALQRELGRGGGGTVYLARDRMLQRQVAVKVLHPHVASRVGAREHLFCEARIATSLRHPQIVTIYDLDETLNMVVMEYCAGGALRDTFPLDPLRSLGRLAEIAAVLDTVHRCGVIHRDLKPSNLLLRRPCTREAPPGEVPPISSPGEVPPISSPGPDSDGRPTPPISSPGEVPPISSPGEVPPISSPGPDSDGRPTPNVLMSNPVVLTDFGIAHAVKGYRPEDGENGMTAEGSLAYMAPEQRRGESLADPRVDLYSCGVVLLEMLLGRAPLSHQDVIQGAVLFEAEDIWREVGQILTGQHGADLLALAQGMVHPNPNKRPSSAAEVFSRASSLGKQVRQKQELQVIIENLKGRLGPYPTEPQLRWLRDPWN